MNNPDEKKFFSAYDAYAEPLYRHCYFRVYSKDRAEELVQETFMRAWEYMQKGNEIRNMQAFLYTIATRAVVDHARKVKRKKELSLDTLREKGFSPSDDTDMEERTDDAIEGSRVLAVLKHLDDAHREAVIMRYIDNFTPKEIAKITGEDANTISVRIHRGVQKIRTIIKEDTSTASTPQS